MVTIIELCDSLCQLQPKEKDVINEMFDREYKKEKNLEQARKKADLEKKPKEKRDDHSGEDYEEELNKLEAEFERLTGEQPKVEEPQHH